MRFPVRRGSHPAWPSVCLVAASSFPPSGLALGLPPATGPGCRPPRAQGDARKPQKYFLLRFCFRKAPLWRQVDVAGRCSPRRRVMGCLPASGEQRWVLGLWGEGAWPRGLRLASEGTELLGESIRISLCLANLSFLHFPFNFML